MAAGRAQAGQAGHRLLARRPRVQVLGRAGVAGDARRGRAGEVPCRQPARQAGVERGVQPARGGADHRPPRSGLDLGGAPPRPGLDGRRLGQHRLGDRPVEIGDERREIAAGPPRGVQELDPLALGQGDPGPGGDALHRPEQAADLLLPGPRRIGRLGRRRAEFVQRDRPEAQPVALEPDRPGAPARRPRPVRQPAMLGRHPERHELRRRQGGAARRRGGHQQRRARGAPAEALRGAGAQVGEPDPARLRLPQRLGDREPVPDRVQQLAADAVEGQRVELGGQRVGGQAVGARRPARRHRPRRGDRGVEPLGQARPGLLVAQRVAPHRHRVAAQPRQRRRPGLGDPGGERGAAPGGGAGDLARRRAARPGFSHRSTPRRAAPAPPRPRRR